MERAAQDVVDELMDVRERLAQMKALHARQNELYLEGYKLGVPMAHMAAAGGPGREVNAQRVRNVIRDWEFASLKNWRAANRIRRDRGLPLISREELEGVWEAERQAKEKAEREKKQRAAERAKSKAA